jgi:hypothetical protein
MSYTINQLAVDIQIIKQDLVDINLDIKIIQRKLGL